MANFDSKLVKHYESNKEQIRQNRPRVLTSVTLLDILANGTAIRLFREAIGGKDATINNRLVISVRRPLKKGWTSVQHTLPADQMQEALLRANQIAQMEIQRVSIAAIA